MIEIKNKRMIIFPEERLIGAEGDIKSSERKFSLDRIQNGFDLSNMVAWIKIEPKGSGEAAYNQLLKRENLEDKIILTWCLTGANLKNAGELEAQIIFASPDYFNEVDLNSLKDTDVVLPSIISGVSAPVWQSYKETFIVTESIDDAIAYKEVKKNVLIAAVAEAVAAAEDAEAAREDSSNILGEITDKATKAEADVELAVKMADKVEEVYRDSRAIEENNIALYASVMDTLNVVNEHQQDVKKSMNTLQMYHVDCSDYHDLSEAYSTNCEYVYQRVLGVKDDINKTEQRIKQSQNYRLVYSKTLSSEDTDCISFEISEDAEGNPIDTSDFVIYLYVPRNSEGENTYLKVLGRADDLTNSANLAQFVGILKSSDVYARIECKNKGRWVSSVTKSTQWYPNAESCNVQGPVCAQQRVLDGKNANIIKISQKSDNPQPFKEGTMIEVWCK